MNIKKFINLIWTTGIIFTIMGIGYLACILLKELLIIFIVNDMYIAIIATVGIILLLIGGLLDCIFNKRNK